MAMVFVWEPGVLGHYWDTAKRAMRKLLRPRIFEAIEHGKHDAVYRLATTHRLTTARNEFGARPLSAAIACKQTAIACGLIDRGGWVSGDGAVASAVFANDLVVLAKLIHVGADLQEPHRADSATPDWTPLMWATNRHHFSMMELLLAAGADVNARASDGTTAVMCTSAGTDNDIVALDLLCQYKPVLTFKDWRGRTILDEARDRARFSHRTAMRDVLRRHYAELAFDDV